MKTDRWMEKEREQQQADNARMHMCMHVFMPYV